MKKFKTILLLLSVVGLLATSVATVAGTGRAEARWQETPRIGVMGEEVWTVGDNGRCRGSMHVGLQNDPRKPGWVQLTLRSHGFTSNKCKATVKFVYHNTFAPFNHERFFRIEGTKRRGAVIAQKRFFIGSGVDLVSVSTLNPASKGVSYYIAIP
ncbi:hypothetical protein ACFQNE_03040 [Gordonia phosphorivorans]|uniref:Uncharacterized protein n=1 Tax=Gordonia phosphorivorans TaxID=1056982 RepID=A0ABV6H4R3_9ACTN